MLQLREKASQAKSEAGGLAPLAHGVLEAQKEEQLRASELAALKRYSTTSLCADSQYAHRHNVTDRWLHETGTVVCRHQYLQAVFILHKHALAYLAACACSVKCKIESCVQKSISLCLLLGTMQDCTIRAGNHQFVSALREMQDCIVCPGKHQFVSAPRVNAKITSSVQESTSLCVLAGTMPRPLWM